ncbi:MAG: signal recognition particle protein [Alphaproteobacteria bacterium]|nr:signal recognition particle protein [Alphaproteobacteria bacterium]OJV16027.1 MAG: signal recognition particle protein [Alphaproteobacteria bacterium 33-17]
MFESLSDKLSSVFNKLKRKGLITEDDLNQAAREIRIALLEADVALPVVKSIIDQLKERAIGEKVISNVSPVQMIIKIMNDLILEALGAESYDLKYSGIPSSFLFVGLQGAGKTTSAAKLAFFLKSKQNKKILLASSDIYRPAAREQLKKLADQHQLDSLSIISDEKPLDIAKRALKEAEHKGYDILIFDTAGRLHTDEELIQEVIDIKGILRPSETILVADSMTGQDAVNIAKEFSDKVGLTSVILTRIDGDARGGAALSIRKITEVPIKFLATGEKINEFEVFHPDRLASRILGMGDIVSFVEKAASQLDHAEAEKVAKRVMKGNFDLNDLASQIKQMKRMGGLGSIMSFMPGMKQIKDKIGEMNVNEKVFDWQLAIINSMTEEERSNPNLMNGSRRKRIAIGAGRNVQEVNRLLNQYEQMRKVMKQFGKMDPKSLMKSGIGKLFS